MLWFTSDWHFGHKNIIKYCNRPFDSVEHMNNVLLNEINEYAQKDDILFFLGDFCFAPRKKFIEQATEYRNKINCRNIVWIHGNHDPVPYHNIYKYEQFASLFTANYAQYTGYFNGQLITLNHYAMKTFPKHNKGGWQLYGHSHGTLPDDPHTLSMDVGVDCHNYRPISFGYIQQRMALKVFKPVDHHTESTNT